MLYWELFAVFGILGVRGADTVLLPRVPRHLVAEHSLHIELPHELCAFLHGELRDQHRLLVVSLQFFRRMER